MSEKLILSFLPKGYKIDKAFDGKWCMVYTIKCRTFKGDTRLFMIRVTKDELKDVATVEKIVRDTFVAFSKNRKQPKLCTVELLENGTIAPKGKLRYGLPIHMCLTALVNGKCKVHG
jgi:hypothetical protein